MLLILLIHGALHQLDDWNVQGMGWGEEVGYMNDG